MARARRRRRALARVTDLLVLDADGVSKAASNDRMVQAWLQRARELDADLVISAVTLAELVRGRPRDAARHDTARCVLLTSDPADLGALLADHPEVRAVAV